VSLVSFLFGLGMTGRRFGVVGPVVEPVERIGWTRIGGCSGPWVPLTGSTWWCVESRTLRGYQGRLSRGMAQQRQRQDGS